MEKLTGLNLRFDKVVMQFIVPGFIALFPFLIIISKSINELDNFLVEHETISIFIYIFVFLIGGILIESGGSYIEYYVYDKRHKKVNPNASAQWDQYLDLQFDSSKEPIRIRYIRSALFKMKMELSLGISLIVNSLGLILLQHKFKFIDSCLCFTVVILIINLSGFYLIFKEAWNSSAILMEERQKLVSRFWNTTPPNKGFTP